MSNIKKVMQQIKKDLNQIGEKNDCYLQLESSFHNNIIWNCEEDMINRLSITIKVCCHKTIPDETEIANLLIGFIPSNMGKKYKNWDIYSWDIADSLDSEWEEVVSVLTTIYESKDKNSDAMRLSSNILHDDYISYAERLWIHKEFRKEGVASLLIKNIFNIIEIATNFSPSGIAFIPGPYESDEESWDKEKKKLINFYNKFDAIKLSESVYGLENK